MFLIFSKFFSGSNSLQICIHANKKRIMGPSRPLVRLFARPFSSTIELSEPILEGQFLRIYELCSLIKPQNTPPTPDCKYCWLYRFKLTSSFPVFPFFCLPNFPIGCKYSVEKHATHQMCVDIHSM